MGGPRDRVCRVLSICPACSGAQGAGINTGINTVVVNYFFLQNGSLPGITRQALTDVEVDAQEQIKNALLKMDSMCEQRLA